MLYTSTRDNSIMVKSAEAIARGISRDGGLFVPVTIPKISEAAILELASADYVTRAAEILSLYLTDFSKDELYDYASLAYSEEKFSSAKIAPLIELEPDLHVLELWHGPTCAFKDMALQILPHLLTAAVEKTGIDKKPVILVATSGDTGKAALEGFADVDGTEIIVFYPESGVSAMQKLQMITQSGENVFVSGIQGNFDDAQSGVKEIFTDNNLLDRMDDAGLMFSSANSINWGRLAPQIAYYISAYCDMIADGSIVSGQKINIVVPTGNFGNILAAFYAREMGLPVNKLICASNSNNILTDFINTGIYDKNRSFYTTISPSMDILISSNLERLLYTLSGFDDASTKEWMNELATVGRYQVPAVIHEEIMNTFSAGYCDDAHTKEIIKATWDKHGYLFDTHTAVAMSVYRQYVEETGDMTDTIIASTASPYKFVRSVLEAIGGEELAADNEFDMVKEVAAITGVPVPPQISALNDLEPRFTTSCNKADMSWTVQRYLGLI